MTTGLVLDIFIIFLLAASTGYCVVLNRKLGILRQGQKEFVKLIKRFDNATQRAETNIERLRGVSGEIDENLGERISTARALRDELRFLIERAAPAIERSMTTTESRGETTTASRREAPAAPYTMTPRDETSGSVVEADLLEALREARKG